MRLIDADALKKDDEVTEWITRDTIRTGKTLKAFSELFVKKIDNAPTVQAVPIDVLDKIRAEIADLDDADYDYEGYYKAVTDALRLSTNTERSRNEWQNIECYHQKTNITYPKRII